MWLPIHDPFVIFGIALLLSSIFLAIVLLTCVSYRSANEVWASVETRPLTKKQKAARDEKINVGNEPYVTPAGRENGMKHASSVKRAVSKIVRFSSKVQHHSPVPQCDEEATAGERVQGRRFDSVDLADSGRRVVSWNQQQVAELHFG